MISVVIPAKNEQQNIAAMIRAVKPYADEVVVIDGHSTDSTREVSQEEGAAVFLDDGMGKGAGIRRAIEVVTGDVIVFIDADGSHDASDIPALVKPIVENEADLVVASRMTGGSDELHSTFGEAIRLFGSTLINLAINYRLNVRITDAQNGFRAIRKSTAEALKLEEHGTTIEQEMLIKTIRKGFRNAEIPGHEYRRVYGTSSINVRRTGPRYVYSCLKYLFFDLSRSQ